MQSKTFVIENEVGLHARPGALFVQTAAKFDAVIKVKNKTKDTPYANAKSVIGVLGLKVNQGEEIEIIVEGNEAQAALDALTRLIDSNINVS